MLRQLLLLLPMATGSSDMPSAAPVARRLISVNGVGTCPAASHGLATLKGHICPVTKLSIPPVTMCVWPPARDHYISNGIIRQGTWLLPNDESLRQHMVYCFSAAGAARSALCGAAQRCGLRERGPVGPRHGWWPAAQPLAALAGAQLQRRRGGYCSRPKQSKLMARRVARRALRRHRHGAGTLHGVTTRHALALADRARPHTSAHLHTHSPPGGTEATPDSAGPSHFPL